MGNVTGEATAGFVTRQVQQRQDIQGKVTRTEEELQYLTNKNAFVRLASSVVVEEDIKKHGFLGSELAKKFVLFNGVTEIQPFRDGESDGVKSKQTQRAGILNSNDPEVIKNNNNVYGVGGLEFGLSPMMGITQVNIKSENRGSLRTATVDIIANNREQFEIIESLYIKLGYNMLLEWGWTNYFNNNGTYVSPTENQYTLIPKFLERTISYDGFLRLIKFEQEKSNGNYDAFLGRVVNFNWKFNQSGQYVITLVLRSIGDVIEAFKANTLMPSDKKVLDQKTEAKKKEQKELQDQQQEAQQEITNAIFRGVGAESIGRIDNARVVLNLGYKDPVTNELKTFYTEGSSDNYANAVTEAQQDEQAAIEKNKKIQEQLDKNQQELNELLGIRSTIQSELLRLQKRIDDDLVGKNATLTQFIDGEKRYVYFRKYYETTSQNAETGETEYTPVNQYYVTLGYLLYFIQRQMIPFDTRFKSRVINFDLDYENTLALVPPYIFPGSPSNCLINLELLKENNNLSKGKFFTVSSTVPEFTIRKGKNKYGKLLDIYFNVNVVNSLLSDPDIVLIDFFQKLLDIYTRSTGGFNDISVTVDSETNYMRFVDEPSAASDDLVKKASTSRFTTYGYLKNGDFTQSNFIRSLDFNTTVSPKLAMMITAGSTKSGYYPGYDASGLSSLNRGYVDYMKENLNNGEPTEEDLKKNTIKVAGEKYSKALEVVGKFKSLLSKGTLDPILEKQIPLNLRNLISAEVFYATAVEQKTNPNTASPVLGFIPFNASLTLDGISGIKIYNRIEFAQEFLPSNYPTNLKFLVRGVDHTIANNDWTTTLTTFAIAANPFTGTGAEIPSTDVNLDQPDFSTVNTSDPSTWTDKTITSGFPLNPTGHENGPFTKTQIVLHYSAGWQRTDKGKSTIETLNSRPNSYEDPKTQKIPNGWGLSYHYIIDGAGWVEQLVADTDRAFAASNANPTSINISLQNIGYKRNDVLDSSGNLSQPNQTPLVKLVGADGKTEKTYRDVEYAQEITDAQLKSLKALYAKLLSKYKGIEQNGFDFDKLFPPNDKNGNKTTSWDKKTPGFYTHCSVTTGKLDCLPTPKIVNFFKEISTPPELTQREKDSISYTNFKSLIEDIQDIFNLRDNFGGYNATTGDGDPLFEPYKGFTDDEAQAAIALGKWFRSPAQKKRLQLIEAPDREHFREQYNLLVEEMQKSISSNVVFKTTKGGASRFTVNPNF